MTHSKSMFVVVGVPARRCVCVWDRQTVLVFKGFNVDVVLKIKLKLGVVIFVVWFRTN